MARYDVKNTGCFSEEAGFVPYSLEKDGRLLMNEVAYTTIIGFLYKFAKDSDVVVEGNNVQRVGNRREIFGSYCGE